MINRVTQIDNGVPLRRALISVADKTGLEPFMKNLWKLLPSLTVYSTGGTYDLLKTFAPQGRLVAISEYTGQPEMQGGLVKTLDFRVYLGLLSETYNPSHQQDLERTQSVPLDLVVVNLYPFGQVTADPSVTLEAARSHIDIGGPCMLRAAAKNFLRVLPICQPSDYSSVLTQVEQGQGSVSLEFRLAQAKKAFRHTANYDEGIAHWLEKDATVLSDLYQFQNR